jgi:hypothetical protein
MIAALPQRRRFIATCEPWPKRFGVPAWTRRWTPMTPVAEQPEGPVADAFARIAVAERIGATVEATA